MSKEEKNEYRRAWRKANKDKVREQDRKYREKNKEKIRENGKRWRENNKDYYELNKERIRENAKKWCEKNKDYDKQYYELNKEKIKERITRYRNTPKGLRVELITGWKRRGLICDDYDNLYDRYLASTNCEECECKYGEFGDGTGTYKCMDHDHETGLFRNFLCSKCNIRRG